MTKAKISWVPSSQDLTIRRESIMGFIDHTLTWCRGEIFEGRMFFLFGLLILVIALAYWRFGATPYAKGVVIPFALVALFSIAVGLTLNFSNQSRIIKYQDEYSENAEQFIYKEKARTEGFIKWYPYTKFGMAGLTVIGLLLFLFLDSPNWKGIGLGFVLFGFSIVFLDHFSEERANTYHKKVIESVSQLEK
jgi:ABC-type transport system involved in cytochrome c biogenesis permease subunit